jgi:hypothetical protein
MFSQSLSLSQTAPPASVSRLFLNFTSMTRNSGRLLINSLGIPSLVSEWRDVNETESHPFEVILGVDAAYMQSDAYIPDVEGHPCNNAHLFYAMPLNPVFPSFCVHLTFLTTGSLGKSHPLSAMKFAVFSGIH